MGQVNTKSVEPKIVNNSITKDCAINYANTHGIEFVEKLHKTFNTKIVRMKVVKNDVGIEESGTIGYFYVARDIVTNLETMVFMDLNPEINQTTDYSSYDIICCPCGGRFTKKEWSTFECKCCKKSIHDNQYDVY